jgi:bifunctional non-homologous end joining protein LigD
MKRYPDGVAGKYFYEKDKPRYTPAWITTFPVPRRAGGQDLRYIVISDLPALVWCANLANLEIHPFLHRAPQIEQPTAMVFDLDPGEGADILDCAEVAFLLKELFARWKLELFPKVSGSRGLQVYVPLNTKVSYEVTRPLAQAVAALLARQHPELVVAAMAKLSRTGKVFIDWSQNSDFKTTVSVYSLRAKRAFPYVSMPVSWETLRRAMSRRDRESLDFKPEQALEIVKKSGDLFAPMLKLKQRLPRDLLRTIG